MIGQGERKKEKEYLIQIEIYQYNKAAKKGKKATKEVYHHRSLLQTRTMEWCKGGKSLTCKGAKHKAKE